MDDDFKIELDPPTRFDRVVIVETLSRSSNRRDPSRRKDSSKKTEDVLIFSDDLTHENWKTLK